jgi:hypothetical protein
LKTTGFLFLALLALLLAARLCHTGILWAEETLPLAAAQEMRSGHTLYRDFWFDKPPLVALLHKQLYPGPMLRVVGALYAWLACWIAYGFARDLWSEREGCLAAVLLGFFLIFDTPSAVTPLATDLLMLAPHLAAVWMAVRRRPLLAGALAGLAFWISPKGLFVLAACVVWNPAAALFVGFAAAFAAGALMVPPGYWQEVWVWGRIYAGAGFTLSNAILRTLNWMGFHAALAAGFLTRESRSLRWLLWLGISFAGVAAGFRFFPRYYFLLLPALVLLAARGYALAQRRERWIALLLLVPAVRFGATYYQALHPATWRDAAIDQDSRVAAAILRSRAREGDSLFVWGYRPELYLYSGLPAATQYLDSQPLTGVPADRHLTQSTPVETAQPEVRRKQLAIARPPFVVDGLGAYNPQLALTAYPELRRWLSSYREVARSHESIIYELLSLPAGSPLPQER